MKTQGSKKRNLGVRYIKLNTEVKSMEGIKQQVIQLIQALPEGVTMNDI